MFLLEHYGHPNVSSSDVSLTLIPVPERAPESSGLNRTTRFLRISKPPCFFFFSHNIPLIWFGVGIKITSKASQGYNCCDANRDPAIFAHKTRFFSRTNMTISSKIRRVNLLIKRRIIIIRPVNRDSRS